MWLSAVASERLWVQSRHQENHRAQNERVNSCALKSLAPHGPLEGEGLSLQSVV